MTDEPGTDERERLEEVIILCRKRMGRADAKLAASNAERQAASDALDAAQRRLVSWHQENPDPQGSIFEGLSNV